MSPSAGTEMLVWEVQTPQEPGALSPKTWDTGGPLVAGRLPEELPDQCAVATRGGKGKPAAPLPSDGCPQRYCDVYVGIH